MQSCSAWDAVTPMTIENAVIEDAGSSAPELQTLMTEAGMTLLDYVNCDLDLATNQTLKN